MTRPARRALAQRLTQPPPSRDMITGIVTAIDMAQALVTVRPYEGAPAGELLTVPYLTTYAPVAGDVVCLSWVGGNTLICVGPYAPPGTYGPPRARLVREPVMSLANATNTDITWNRAIYASPGMWDGSSASLTAPITGTYQWTAHFAFQPANPAAGIRFIAFIHDTATVMSAHTTPMSSGGNGFQINIAHTHEGYMAAGSKVKVRAYHNQGTALNIDWGIFTMRWVAP